MMSAGLHYCPCRKETEALALPCALLSLSCFCRVKKCVKLTRKTLDAAVKHAKNLKTLDICKCSEININAKNSFRSAHALCNLIED